MLSTTRFLSIWLSAAVLTSTACGGPLDDDGATQEQPLSTAAGAESVTFRTSALDFPNPERGVTQLMDVGDVSQQALLTSRSQGYTLVWGMIQLKKGQPLMPWSSRSAELERWFNQVRASRLKAVVRLVYHKEESFNSAKEPARFDYQQDLTVLRSLFSKYRDVIWAHQLGVYGAYGEWYYTNHISAADRKTLLDDYFANIPSDAFVMVRSPYYKAQYAQGGATAERLARMGIYNDCFKSGNDGQEGYQCYPWPGSCPTALTWKQSIGIDSNTAPMGGETCTDLRGACQAVSSEANLLGTSFLNTKWWANAADGNKTNFDYWQVLAPDCEKAIRRKLGYRFELTGATVPTSIQRNAPFSVSFTVRNTGYAAMPRSRPVMIKLLDATTGAELVYWGTTANPRNWLANGQTFTTTASLTIPSWVPATTKVTLALWIPDATNSLWSMPEYAVRIASRSDAGVDVWLPKAGGVNVLKAGIPMSAP